MIRGIPHIMDSDIRMVTVIITVGIMTLGIRGIIHITDGTVTIIIMHGIVRTGTDGIAHIITIITITPDALIAIKPSLNVVEVQPELQEMLWLQVEHRVHRRLAGAVL